MTNALIVIDVQESFRARPLWRAVSNPEIAERVQRLADAARAAGDLVVWVLHAEPGSGDVFDPASGHVRVFAELAPLPDEPVSRRPRTTPSRRPTCSRCSPPGECAG